MTVKVPPFCSLLLHNVALLLSSSTQWKSSQDIRFAEVEVYMTPSAILFTKQTKIRRVGYCRGEPMYRIHPTPALPLLQNENSTVTGKGISDTSHPLHLQKRDSSWSCPSIVCGSRGCPAVRRSPTLCVASLQPRWCLHRFGTKVSVCCRNSKAVSSWHLLRHCRHKMPGTVTAQGRW